MLCACNREGEERPSILFLHYFTGNLSSGIDNLAEVINKNQNDFNLIATPLDHEEFKVSIRLQLESDNPPDFFSYWAGARTAYLLENDRIEPITELFNDKVDPSIFDESVLKACSYNGEVYMLPITRHYVGFFYNKKVFNSLDLEEPETWDELLEMAFILKGESITPFAMGAKNRWPAQFWFDYIMLRTAGYQYRDELMNGVRSYNDDEVQRVMELWGELINEGLFSNTVLTNDWDDAVLEVTKGESAMTLMGTWAIPLIESEGLIANDSYGFFPFPIIESNIPTVSLGPVDGVLLSKGSRSNYSLDVLNSLSEVETQEVFNTNSGAIAPHVGVEDTIYNEIQLEIKELISQSDYWAFNYDLAATPVVSEAGLNLFIDFIEDPNSYMELLEEINGNL